MPTFLLAMNRIVRRIEVDRHTARRLVIGLHHQGHEQTLDGSGIGGLVVGIGPDLGGMFKPIECGLAREGCAVRTPSGQTIAEHAEDRIVPQLVVIDDILIAERDAENALAQQRWKLMDNKCRTAAILEAIGEARDEADRRSNPRCASAP